MGVKLVKEKAIQMKIMCITFTNLDRKAVSKAEISDFGAGKGTDDWPPHLRPPES